MVVDKWPIPMQLDQGSIDVFSIWCPSKIFYEKSMSHHSLQRVKLLLGTFVLMYFGYQIYYCSEGHSVQCNIVWSFNEHDLGWGKQILPHMLYVFYFRFVIYTSKRQYGISRCHRFMLIGRMSLWWPQTPGHFCHYPKFNGLLIIVPDRCWWENGNIYAFPINLGLYLVAIDKK